MNPIDYIFNLGWSAIGFFISTIFFAIVCTRTLKQGWDIRQAANLLIFATIPLLIGIWGMSVKLPLLLTVMNNPDYPLGHLQRPISALYPLQTGSAMSVVFFLAIPLVARKAAQTNA